MSSNDLNSIFLSLIYIDNTNKTKPLQFLDELDVAKIDQLNLSCTAYFAVDHKVVLVVPPVLAQAQHIKG